MVNSLPEIQDIVHKLSRSCQGGTALHIGGLWGDSYLYILSTLLPENNRPIVLLVTPSIEEAENALEIWPSFLSAEAASKIRLFPAWESFLQETANPDSAIMQGRLQTLLAISGNAEETEKSPHLIVTSIQALLQDVIFPKGLKQSECDFKTGGTLVLKNITERLIEAEFERVDKVTLPGEFSVRGGLIDIYPYQASAVSSAEPVFSDNSNTSIPIRIELIGDAIESIRTFNPETQLSEETLDGARCFLVKKSEMFKAGSGNSADLFDYLPAGTLVILKEPAEIAGRAAQYLNGLPHPDSNLRVRLSGSASSPLSLPNGSPPKPDKFSRCYQKIQSYPLLTLQTLPVSGFPKENCYNFQVKSLQRFSGGLVNLSREIELLQSQGQKIIVFCRNQAEKQRLRELLKNNLNKLLEIKTGDLQTGFHWPAVNTVFISHQELFNKFRLFGRLRAVSRAEPLVRRLKPPADFRQSLQPAKDTFFEFNKGDLVVHSLYGIGRYLGIEKLKKEKEAGQEEFLAIEYQEKSKVYVPVSQIDLVQKYVGGTEQPPVLSKLGTNLWALKKERVRESTVRLARELLEVQALRLKKTGIAYPPDEQTEWQQEFEAAFPYEDTPDQMTVNQQIKQDMSSGKPMDRLICGDVGYGKTELAIRAAFKAASYGKQVAVLVPTTVLAQQHYFTFSERMMDYPFNIEALSRFKSKKDQSAIVEKLAAGQVDIIIGTHRLLQPDIRFNDLGLIIIDEEQRFGVEHKERLKRLRATVDILTLTATPIPRTLHMALLGLRDISSLNTPPRDRRSVETQVVRFDWPLIKEAVSRELNRDGQVYFVHNRVYDIENIAVQLQKLVPEASVQVAHGQLSEDLLEKRMEEFIKGTVDILVCTNIIESGLDIPRANTLFVNNADMFGLADLHQLRGRVGRYKHQAFAYFLVPTNRPVLPEATRRLKAIQEFNELGAGFKIAIRDMEIRGAGNILGAEQHGYIAAVGYDLYCRLLEESVRRLKRLLRPAKSGTTQGEEVNEPAAVDFRSEVNLNISAYLTPEYIGSEKQRMEIYRKIARVKDEKEITVLRQELEDRFGRPVPEPAENLLQLAGLRILAAQQEISSLTRGIHNLENKEIIIAVYHNKYKAGRLKRRWNKLARVIDDRTIYFSLNAKVFDDSAALIKALRKILSA